MGFAFKRYGEWKQVQLHQNAITGKKTIDYSTSPFAEASRGHLEKIAEGSRYIAGTEEIDQYYKEKMTNMATKYNAEHGVVRPQMKPHPDYDPSKRRSWFDGLFD